MAFTLPTSDLPVPQILSTLGVTRAHTIFRNLDDSLKTTDEIWAKVNKWGLGNYCPGTDGAAKLVNLRSDRKLSYFKGYQHDADPMTAQTIFAIADGGTYYINVNCAKSDYEWYYYSKNRTWIGIESAYNHVGNFAFEISISQNIGAARDGVVTFKGEPKLYGQSDFVLSVQVNQAEGQV